MIQLLAIVSILMGCSQAPVIDVVPVTTAKNPQGRVVELDLFCDRYIVDTDPYTEQVVCLPHKKGWKHP